MASLPPAQYLAFADAASALLTPSIVKRHKRISKAGASHVVREAQLYFESICGLFGDSVAIDIFEQTLAIHQEKNPSTKQKGKPPGAHDSDRDRLLLAIFNDGNPESPISLAREGKLKLYSTEEPRRYTMHDLAECMRKNKYWGAASADQLLRRLKAIRAKHRTK